MGTALQGSSIAALGNSTIKLSAGWNAFWYWGVWAVCIAGLAIVLWSALRSKRWDRWTTQDILIVAALGVLLEVYDNIIGDQFIKPLIDVIPGADLLQIHDLPYMFLLLVGVALVRTLAEHYDGTTWSIVRTPKTGPEASYLYGIATLPNGTAWATGTYTQAPGHQGRALTEHWNGHQWTIVPAANPGAAEDMLYGATAASRGQVWAVGTYGDTAGYFHPLIEGWTGRRWTVRPVRGLRRGAHGILTSVTSGASGVWAAGQLSAAGTDREVVLQLRRGTWRVVSERPVHTAGGIAADAYPQAVAVGADGRLWVAGRYRSGHSGYRTFAAAAGASSGLVQLRTPDPTRQDNYLWGVAAVRGGDSAWAVGDSIPPSTANASALIEFGSATGGWVTVPSPDPGAANGNTILDGVFAVSDSNVWAVGAYDGAGGMRTLILHYTGGAV
jgi:hypothetical protein